MFSRIEMKFTKPKVYIILTFGFSLVMVGLTFSMLQNSGNNIKAIKSERLLDYDVEKMRNEIFERRKVLSDLGLLNEYSESRILQPKSSHSEDSDSRPLSKPDTFMQKIVYNRVGKCGSRSMLSLITKLSSQNNFTFYPSPISNQSKVPLMDMIKVIKRISDLPTPSIYSRHIHYLDFAKFGIIPPICINMIRDPIERFSSGYHFLRYGDNNKAEGRAMFAWKKGEKEMNINDCILNSHPSCSGDKLFYITPYFCGQDIMCQRPSKESLYRAKVHVMENYLVVGYLEDFDGMLQVLEKILPNYFSGATEVWKTLSGSAMSHTTTLGKTSINSTARALLKERMREEYDFYNFVKLRFRILKKQMGIGDV